MSVVSMFISNVSDMCTCTRCGNVVEVLYNGYCDICYGDMYGI